MSGVGNVGASQQIQEKKPIQNNSEAQAAKTAQDGVSVFTQNLVEGKGLDDALMATNQMIQKSVAGALKSAASQFLKMLLGGNDSADAAKDATTTATHIGTGTKILTQLQTKLIDGSLAALQQLVTEGHMDMETYANSLSQIAIQVGVEGAEATVFGEEQQKLLERNKEIEAKLKELGYSIDSDNENKGEIVLKDKDGNEIPVKSDDKNNSVNPEIAKLLDEYNKNNGMIAELGKQINTVIEGQSQVSEKVTEGMTDLLVKGEDLGTVIANQATELINEGVNDITNTMMEQIGLLQTDAVSNYTQAAVDSGAAAAAPGLAAAETAATFGFGAGHAATILANGVADGIAAGLRTTTGSSAVGGIAAAVAGGQGLSQAVSSTLAQEAQNFIQGQVNELTTSLTNELFENKEAIDESSKELETANVVKEDKKSA